MYSPTKCSCSIQQALSDLPIPENFVQITNAEKRQTDSTRSSSSSYVVYTISVKNVKEAKRRYSEFESFRKSLVKLYPTALVPPIPEKHSISDYASQKQKDDTGTIEKRKRMLQRFLTRLVLHPVLNQEHVVHRFLDGNYTWSDILHSAPLSNLPKDPLLSSDSATSFTSNIITNNLPTTVTTAVAGVTSSGLSGSSNGNNNGNSNNNHNIINSNMPIPSTSYTLKYPDNRFEDSEQKVDKPARNTTNQFEKSQKRVLRRLGDLSNDYSELGSAYNALSLNETGAISASIEKIGQVIDGSSTLTKEMVNSLEIEFAEHVQDYTQYVYIAKQILRYRRMKQAQLELIEEAIDTKKNALRSLVRTEDEAQKLKTSLDQLSISSSTTSAATANKLNNKKSGSYSSGSMVDDDSNIDTESIEDGFSAIIKAPNGEDNGDDDEFDQENNKETIVDNQQQTTAYPSSASAPILRASKNQTKKWSSPRKLFSAVTDTIQGMIDTDPEQTRRNQIVKLKDTIDQLEEVRVSTRQELKDMAVSIQADFDRLQVQKESELKSILIAFAKIHMQYCEQNMASWKDIRNEVNITMDNLL